MDFMGCTFLSEKDGSSLVKKIEFNFRNFDISVRCSSRCASQAAGK